MSASESIKAFAWAQKRRLHVRLVDRGYPPRKKVGIEGIEQLGHRGYVGREWETTGRYQYEFMLRQGLKPSDVLCDVGCGSLRGGWRLIKYLDPGHYLGLEAEQRLVAMGLEQEVGAQVAGEKFPEFVISSTFEFSRFSRSPTIAMAISLFSHLTPSDICLCLSNLAAFVKGPCRFFATFNEVKRPTSNYARSHAHLAFYYTRAQMEEFGRATGWRPAYVGGWGNLLAQQRMLQYTISG